MLWWKQKDLNFCRAALKWGVAVAFMQHQKKIHASAWEFQQMSPMSLVRRWTHQETALLHVDGQCLWCHSIGKTVLWCHNMWKTVLWCHSMWMPAQDHPCTGTGNGAKAMRKPLHVSTSTYRLKVLEATRIKNAQTPNCILTNSACVASCRQERAWRAAEFDL